MAWLGKARLGQARQGMARFLITTNGNERMEIESYKWKNRPKAGLIPATVAYECLMDIKQSNDGELTPNDVVKTASNPDSPLHCWFTWDDTEAARLHRLNEASSLIRSIEITYREIPNVPMRAFEISVRKQLNNPQSKTIYSTAEEAALDPEYHQRLVREAKRALQAWKSRFASLTELHRLMVAIDTELESIENEIVHVGK